MPVVSVYHHGLGRILAPDDTESTATGPGLGRHAQAIGTPSALGEPETHRGLDSIGIGKLPHAQSATPALNAPISRPGLSEISMAPDSSDQTHSLDSPTTR